MKIIIVIALALALPAHAQVYKCTEGGKTVYSQTPCPTSQSNLRPRSSGAALDMRREIEAEYERLQAEREDESTDEDDSLPVPLSPSESRYSAAWGYTPAQLMRMVGSGTPPQQGPASSESERMEFYECIGATEAVMAPLRGTYPVVKLMTTKDMYMTKVWLNDSAMIITCSKADRKRVVTTAPYR